MPSEVLQDMWLRANGHPAPGPVLQPIPKALPSSAVARITPSPAIAQSQHEVVLYVPPAAADEPNESPPPTTASVIAMLIDTIEKYNDKIDALTAKVGAFTTQVDALTTQVAQLV